MKNQKRNKKRCSKVEITYETFFSRAVGNLMEKKNLTCYYFNGTITPELRVELDKVLGKTT